MGGYIGASAGNLANAAERKQTYTITTSTTSLTGLAYTPTKVHVFHNGVRLVDGTDYTATNGTSITLTNAAQNGDEVVVISYPSFQTSDTVSAANGGTFAGNVSMSGTLGVTGVTTLSSDLNVDTIKNTSGTTGLTIDSNGFVLPKAVAFSAYLSANQSLTAATWTKAAFNTEEYDTNSDFDTTNNRFLPSIAGYYQINCSFAWFNGASTAGLMEFRKNGSSYRQGAYTYHANQSLDDYQLEASIMVYMNGSTD